MRAVVLSGGTGGAKLAAGMQEILGVDLTVIANTGDDIEALGVYVSPDPDLCTYWLSGEIDEERGWGIRGDSFNAFERMVELGAPDWFGLSDRDLALCLRRRVLLDDGATLTEVQQVLSAGLGVRASVLPMCDEPVRTRVQTATGWRSLQQHLIRDQTGTEVLAVEFAGIAEARISDEIRAAVEAAEVILIGPSNPVISIGPILVVPGMRDLLAGAPAPVVAVSPFVAGQVVKGPTAEFLRAAGVDAGASGVAALYAGLIDAFVIDAADPEPPPSGIPTTEIDTLMTGPERRREVAAAVLDYCNALAGV